jgi:hypothetical protein
LSCRIGDIHVPLGAVPELVALIAQDCTGCPDRLSTGFPETRKLRPITVDDASAKEDMEEIAGMGRSVTDAQVSPAGGGIQRLGGDLFETVQIASVALRSLVHKGICQLRAPRVIQLLVQWRLFGWCEMGERMSDHFRHPGPNPIELLKPVRMSPELVHGPNVLAPQHCPGDGGQIEISDWPCAGIIETGHRTLLSLAGGSARISQPPDA